MITGITESKILAKNISWECKYKFDCRKCNSDQKKNNDKWWHKCKNPEELNACEKGYICIPATWFVTITNI